MYSCFHSVGLPDRSLDRGDPAWWRTPATTRSSSMPRRCPGRRRTSRPRPAAEARRAVVAACRERGLTIPAVGAHIGMVGADPAAREAAIAFVNGCTDIAVDVGAPVVHILSGPLEPGVDRDAAWGWFRSAVERTTDYASSRNITLGIEAIAGHVFHGVDDYHRLRRELPGVPFKVNFDPSHLAVQNEDPMRVVRELGDQIVHVHLKDGKGLYPNFEFPPLGKGTIDFPALVDGAPRRRLHRRAFGGVRGAGLRLPRERGRYPPRRARPSTTRSSAPRSD